MAYLRDIPVHSLNSGTEMSTAVRFQELLQRAIARVIISSGETRTSRPCFKSIAEWPRSLLVEPGLCQTPLARRRQSPARTGLDLLQCLIFVALH